MSEHDEEWVVERRYLIKGPGVVADMGEAAFQRFQAAVLTADECPTCRAFIEAEELASEREALELADQTPIITHPERCPCRGCVSLRCYESERRHEHPQEQQVGGGLRCDLERAREWYRNAFPGYEPKQVDLEQLAQREGFFLKAERCKQEGNG